MLADVAAFLAAILADVFRADVLADVAAFLADVFADVFRADVLADVLRADIDLLYVLP